jgi:hypothetical protein
MLKINLMFHPLLNKMELDLKSLKQKQIVNKTTKLRIKWPIEPPQLLHSNLEALATGKIQNYC